MIIKIQSITIVSQITPCLKGSPVQLPNWKPGKDLEDGSGSKRPGVFQLTGKNNKNPSTLELRVKVIPPKAFDQAVLTGTLDDMEFSGTVEGGNGPVQTVKAVLKKEPKEFRWLFGDVKWTLTKGEHLPPIKLPPLPLPDTRLEIYWIYGYPGKMYKKGVWIEVLRTIVSQFSSAPYGYKDIIQRV
ncbi:MAG: hypothetical protein GY940_48170, partial [bacterium]|nr:hypothetical protein [bacterium]